MTTKRFALLLSVRPCYLEKILDGSKSVELRRVIPQLSKGDTVAFYASRPVGAVVGTARVRRVVSGSPSRLWRELGGCTGVSRREFRNYFAGSPCAHGIQLADATATEKPITLDQLRQELPGFRPPQNYMYVGDSPQGTRSALARLLSFRLE